MAPQDSTTPARFDTLHELLAHAQRLGLTVTMNVHGVPTEELLDWLQLGLLDGIEKGAGGNTPTGRMESGEWPRGKAEACCFMEDENERRRRIEREEDEKIAALREELGVGDES